MIWPLQDYKVLPITREFVSIFPAQCIVVFAVLCSKVMGKKGLKTVLWIRIGFNEDSDPDPAFYIRIRIQGAKPMRINADTDSSHTLKSQKVEFLHEKNILRVVNRSKRFCGGRAFFICKSVELYSSFKTNAKSS
jgi:hypothetical protein